MDNSQSVNLGHAMPHPAERAAARLRKGMSHADYKRIIDQEYGATAVKRPDMRHPPCAVECRCDGNQVYAAIGDPDAGIRGESGGVIGFGDTLADALRSLADEIEKEVKVTYHESTGY